MYIDPLEKFMDEYVGTATELRGPFNIHSSNIVDDNLKQIILQLTNRLITGLTELKKPGEK